MTEIETHPNQAAALRRDAEKIARENADLSPENLLTLSHEETRHALHELRVHQIELEMQSEELRQRQEELDAARARYFDLYDLAPVGYVTLSQKGTVIEANLTAATLLEVTRGALVKAPFSSFIIKEDQDIYFQFRKQLFKTGKPQVCELRVVKKENQTFWAFLEATVAQGPATGEEHAGESVGRVTMSDITELKRKEAHNLLEQMVEKQSKQLRQETEQRKWPQAIFQEGADTILLVDDEPHVLSALTRSLRNTGYEIFTAADGIQALEIMETTKIKVIVSDEQMEGMLGSELLAEVQKRFPNTLRMLLTGHATLEMAMQAVNDGGIYRFLTKPWDDALLRFALSAATEKYNSDAERRRLQDALRQSEERCRTVVEFSPHAVVIHRHGTIIYANPATIRMFGATSLKDLTGSSYLDRIHPDDHETVLARVQKKATEGVSSPVIELKYLRFDGTIIIVEAQGTPILYDGLPAIHTAIHDITNRKQSEKALRDAHDLLELRVAERTGELRHTNEQLTTEITAHERSEESLTAKSRELEQTNTALQVLLRNREEDLRQTEQKIVANLQKLVLPYIGELKELGLSPGQANHVEIIGANLQQVISPFMQNLTARYSAFTPREIQIANLIKEGKTSKEIATLVKVAPHSVEFHRNNIRKKLGLSGKKTNLRSFLLTLS
jgi:PAS domain S-box-containing protein